MAEELGVTYSDVTKMQPSARGRHLNIFSKYDVLVIDEWLKNVPDEESISFIFELMERREDKHMTIFVPSMFLHSWTQ